MTIRYSWWRAVKHGRGRLPESDALAAVIIVHALAATSGRRAIVGCSDSSIVVQGDSLHADTHRKR